MRLNIGVVLLAVNLFLASRRIGVRKCIMILLILASYMPVFFWDIRPCFYRRPCWCEPTDSNPGLRLQVSKVYPEVTDGLTSIDQKCSETVVVKPFQGECRFMRFW